MAKLSLFVFVALIESFILVSGLIDNIGKIDTRWKCPPVAEVGTTCKCDEVKSSIHCNGATYQEMEIFFNQLKSNNPDGAHVDLFRMENYTNETLDVTIFTPCTIYTAYNCPRNRVDLTFGTMDFRNNSDLKYLVAKLDTDDRNRIGVQNLFLSNCSLRTDNSLIDRSIFYGLKIFGSKLEHVDFSQNHMTSLKVNYNFGTGFDWPNLKTLNLSKNKITDIGYAWFEQTPNVDIIDLSDNTIQNIWNEAFTMNNPDPDKSDKEIIINLSNNQLSQTSRLYDTMFVKLKRPTKIILSQNDFNYLPKSAFSSFLNKRVDLIDISNNQLICDCQSEWLRSMAVIYENRVINYNCWNMKNISIFKVEENLCDKC